MIRLDPPYQPIVQLPVLCGPTCLAMVLARHDIPMNQEEVAQALNAYVRETERGRYRLNHPTAAPDDYARLGIRLIGLDAKLNRLARECGWPLFFELWRLSEISDLGQLIAVELEHNHDVVINFWLNESRPKRSGIGHFVLAESIDERGTVTVVDPDTAAVSSRWTIDVSPRTH